jgi:AcrR family transcriptional regulator
MERVRRRTKTALVEAAIALIVERGYDAVRVSDITEAANYGRSTFYVYFRDKEDLFWKILKAQMDQLDARILAAVEGLPSPERERLAWGMIFEAILQARPFFLQMDGELSRRLRQLQKDYLIATYERQLREGLYSLMLDAPPELAARFICGAILEILEYWMHHPEMGDAQAMADQMYRLVFRREPPQPARVETPDL